MKVLLFDGNMITSSKIASTLRSAGFEVVVGKEFQEVKVALVNLESPGGEEFLKEIKENHPEIKVVAYCGHKNTQMQKRAKDLGADMVVPNSKAVLDPVSLVKEVL